MSFSEIMEHHAERLIRVAYYYTRDLQIAEDIVQEVFIKFHKQQRLYTEYGELRAYLTRCTINRSKDYLKSWHARKMQFQERWLQTTKDRELDNVIREDEQSLVTNAVMQLPLKYREVLVYYYFEEMTIVQISELLRVPESTVKTRMRRAKELLKPTLQQVEWEVLLND